MKAIQILIALAVATGAAQVNAEGMSMNMPMSSTHAKKKDAPFVKAEVVKADAASGMVTLKHEDIPNLDMPGMTMEFAVANKKLLKGVKAGDKVRVKFDTVKDRPTVIALKHGK